MNTMIQSSVFFAFEPFEKLETGKKIVPQQWINKLNFVISTRKRSLYMYLT